MLFRSGVRTEFVTPTGGNLSNRVMASSTAEDSVLHMRTSRLTFHKKHLWPTDPSFIKNKIKNTPFFASARIVRMS